RDRLQPLLPGHHHALSLVFIAHSPTAYREPPLFPATHSSSHRHQADAVVVPENFSHCSQYVRSRIDPPAGVPLSAKAPCGIFASSVRTRSLATLASSGRFIARKALTTCTHAASATGSSGQRLATA